MKHIDDLLERSATASPQRELRNDFTKHIIHSITHNPRPASRWTVFKETIQMKRKNKPAMAASILVGAIVLSGSTYAFVNWFGADVQTSTANNTVTISAKNCPANTIQADKGKTQYDISTTYKIVNSKVINAEELKDEQLVRCERQAIEAIARKTYPDAYNLEAYRPSNVYNGLYLPFSHAGTITNAEGQFITVSDILIDHSQSEPEKISVRLRIDSDTVVLEQGKNTNLSAFKPGDQIFFTFQNTETSGEGVDKMWIPTTATTKVRVLSKTQYSYKIEDKIRAAIQSGALEIVTTTEEGAG